MTQTLPREETRTISPCTGGLECKAGTVYGGIWVHLRAFPVCDVFVADEQIARARKPHEKGSNGNRPSAQIANCIAIGLRAGVYEPEREPKPVRGVCSLPGCERPHKAHTLCQPHYQQARIALAKAGRRA
jgi:hypothetical protein